MGYLKPTIKGLGWIGGGRLFSRAFAYARLAVLARLLTPADFGSIGVATLVLSFLEILTETGVNTVLIQKKESIDDFIDTSWVISIIRGLGIGIIILLSAPIIVRFFDSKDAYPLLVLTSLIPVIRGFINPSIVKFQKDLNFNQEFFFRNSIFVVDSIVAIVLALITKRPESLILGFILAAMLEVVLSFKFATPIPRFKLDTKKANYIIKHGKWMTGQGILGYIFRQGDDIVVGRMLGIVQLGYYEQAYKISTLPITEIADVAGKVTFPVFSKMGDISRILKAFKKSFLSISLASVILGTLVFVFPSQIISLILGDDWLPAASVLRILAIFGVLSAINSSFFPLFLALKKQKYTTNITLIGSTALFISIFPLIRQFGIEGAGYATIIGVLASMPLTAYYYMKISNIKENI